LIVDTGAALVDVEDLTAKVKAMYKAVAERPDGRYHFELGRGLAERLGYPASVLDAVPGAALESFAGVGYFFDLAGLVEGETVLDLGSGSGTDVFFAALQVGEGGHVTGIDMTVEQLDKAERLAADAGFDQVGFANGRLEELPFEDGSFDVVISNGVINLVADKVKAFSEAARVLRTGGRLAIADIVTERELTEAIVCNTDLWASCIGGATQQDRYEALIKASGLTLKLMKRNDYAFLSNRARDAGERYGVKSISILARKEGSE
jgi:SAM-dependent methyltransferase